MGKTKLLSRVRGKLAIHSESHLDVVSINYLLTAYRVWKQVHAACIEKQEFRLAQTCGLNVVVHAEELAGVLAAYERRGYFDEVLALMEAGLSLERAHMGIFTKLSILYSKYQPEKRESSRPTPLIQFTDRHW